MSDQQETLYPSKVLASIQLLCFFFSLCCCRHCYFPLHRDGDLVLQGAGPQQLHLPLGDSGGTKGKTESLSITKRSSDQTQKSNIYTVCNAWPLSLLGLFSEQVKCTHHWNTSFFIFLEGEPKSCGSKKKCSLLLWKKRVRHEWQELQCATENQRTRVSFVSAFVLWCFAGRAVDVQIRPSVAWIHHNETGTHCILRGRLLFSVRKSRNECSRFRQGVWVGGSIVDAFIELCPDFKFFMWKKHNLV